MRQAVLCVLAGLLFVALAPAAPAEDWVEYENVSALRIVADEGAPDPVGLTPGKRSPVNGPGKRCSR